MQPHADLIRQIESMDPSKASLADLMHLQAQLEQATTSPDDWIERHLKIQNKKDGKLIPFKFNRVQRKAYEILQKRKAKGLPLYFIILKFRQGGISTLAEGLCYERMRRVPQQHAFIVGNELENSNHLYGMFRRFYRNDPDHPQVDQSNRKQLIFAEPHGSTITVSTAAKAQAGTGHTNHFLHLSELAKWNDAETTMLSLMQTVPMGEDSIVIIESTAKGVGGYFYDEYWAAKAGETEFEAIFLAWFEHDEYQIPLQKGEVLEGLGEHPRYNEYEGEETQLQVQFGVTKAQLKWRRWAINNRCKGDVELFHQEYPSTEVEAFLSTGRPVFPVGVLRQWEEQATPPVFRGRLVREGGMTGVFSSPLLSGDRPDVEEGSYQRIIEASAMMYGNQGFVDPSFIAGVTYLSKPAIVEVLLYEGYKRARGDAEQYIRPEQGVLERGETHVITPVEDPEGMISIWQWPTPNRVYCAGADVAQGEMVNDQDSDYDAAHFLDKVSFDVVATFHGRVPTDEFARQLWLMGMYFNRALLAVEVNNHGWSVLDKLRKSYGNLYHRVGFDQEILEHQRRIGWHTHSGSKPIMVDDAIAYVRHQIGHLPCAATIQEMLSFVRLPEGGMAGQQGRHDDLVMSFCIALQCAKHSSVGEYLRKFNPNQNVVRSGMRLTA